MDLLTRFLIQSNFYSSCLPPDPKVSSVPFKTRKMGWRVAVLAASFSFLSCSWLITPKVSSYLHCPRVKIQTSNNKQGPDFTSWPQPNTMYFVRQQWRRDYFTCCKTVKPILQTEITLRNRFIMLHHIDRSNVELISSLFLYKNCTKSQQ
jgi:hypothetical protein